MVIIFLFFLQRVLFHFDCTLTTTISSRPEYAITKLRVSLFQSISSGGEEIEMRRFIYLKWDSTEWMRRKLCILVEHWFVGGFVGVDLAELFNDFGNFSCYICNTCRHSLNLSIIFIHIHQPGKEAIVASFVGRFCMRNDVENSLWHESVDACRTRWTPLAVQWFKYGFIEKYLHSIGFIESALSN